ncbi:MAG: internal scaffolding protein [Microviridae sp.]|nr:MAG: internal scaffolding protein [Microviridae sp.]
MTKIFLRTAYNFDVDANSIDFALSGFEPTLTVQDAKDDCDINVIMERFGKGIPVPTNLKTPMQGDFTGVMDYQSSLNLIIEADEAFMQLPADVRFRFNNDPGQFLDFVSDDTNIDEARKMGLLIPKSSLEQDDNPAKKGDSASDSAPVA